MVSTGKTLWERLKERLRTLGDNDRVQGIIKTTHIAVSDLADAVEDATPARADEPDTAPAPPAPLPMARKTATAARGLARSRAASPARSPARTAAKSGPKSGKPRGAASEPAVEDAAAPQPKVPTRKRTPDIKAIPGEEPTAAIKKPARPKRPPAAKAPSLDEPAKTSPESTVTAEREDTDTFPGNT